MAQQFQEALIRKRKVLEMTGWSNSTLYARIASKDFKPGVKVGPRMVAWPLSEVEAYIQARIAERDVGIGVPHAQDVQSIDPLQPGRSTQHRVTPHSALLNAVQCEAIRST